MRPLGYTAIAFRLSCSTLTALQERESPFSSTPFPSALKPFKLWRHPVTPWSVDWLPLASPAFNISGQTYHSAFGLLVDNKGAIDAASNARLASLQQE